jgi:formamidopyrimidine-DNA glycosylase
VTRWTRSSTTRPSSSSCAGAVPGLKRALLDQTLVSGIGNIYADETLWRAQLHGERPTDRLTRPAARRVLGHARDVLREAVAPVGRASTRCTCPRRASAGCSSGR